MAKDTTANKFNADQLIQRQLVITAMYNHFGYDANGKELPNREQTKLPEFKDNVPFMKEKNYYHKQWCVGSADGTDQALKFFNVQQGGKIGPVSNLQFATLPDGKCFVITGFRFRQALNTTQTAGDNTANLDFGATVLDALENSRVTIEVNKVKILEDEQISHVFRNDDAIPDYYRLATPVCLEPNSSMLFELTSNSTVSKWVEVTAMGFLFEK